MQHEVVQGNLRQLAFDFFYWFSRFEYALKDGHFLRSEVVGIPAEPSWKKFCQRYRDVYKPGPAAKALLDASPERQIVATGGGLDFEPVPFNPGVRDLDKVAELARTVRNTLFHGGKHGSNFWDDPTRMELLLRTTIDVLDELAKLGDLQAEYRREY
ncbi:hypothetical protein [Sphingomonas sp. TREG-RG-20F-R18-01]|uniref:hypothetical protein n=1 Tax=Sphingomonas sp. TREG-RG-20F-R18-01 TaxID=2914982 RepID=UPI001F5A8B69|nr:hypothetical protein [Sphingomonas sp. TREG-RG-20F-R18-01]